MGGRQVREHGGEGLKVGGFQSGFHARVVSRDQCKWPEYLICNHDCQRIIQLVSHVSGEVEFELCHIEAARMAQVLLHAAAKARGEEESK